MRGAAASISMMASSFAMHSCQCCCYVCHSWRDLMRHAFECHSSEPNFTFSCGYCAQTFNNYRSMTSHLTRKHKGSFDQQVATVNFPFVSSEQDGNDQPIDDDVLGANLENNSAEQVISLDTFHHSLRRSAALFLLTLKEKHKLTQVALNFAVGQVQHMVAYASETVKYACLNGDELTDPIDPFEELHSEHLQTKYYKENFGLLEPVTIVLNTYIAPGPRGTFVERKDTFQYVPILESLKGLLRNQEILDEVLRPHTRDDGFLGDYCDGSFLKSHHLFEDSDLSLQIIAYYDEVEVCDPLSSRSGVHKLGLFYYTLGNLRPELRSTHRSIQLIACITSPNLKTYGFKAVLKPFIEDMNELNKNGMTITINGERLQFRGAVVALLADTLAAHDLGGFKVGVGFALRKCRLCLATNADIQTKFTEEEFIRRTPDSHDYHCSLLSGPLAEQDSVTYGVNALSPLNELEDFHVASGQLPQDIMHILFEGVLQLNIRLMLNKFVNQEKLLTLEELNDRIASFPYGRYEAKNKPSKYLDQNHLKGKTKLPFTATQMWTFSTLLPLMIGDKVAVNDNPAWECFLLLLRISKLCTAKILSLPSVMYLASLISQHHQEFKKCYPSVNLPPKTHYLVHIPQQILMFGPPISAWCLRMEAKNSYFKSVAVIGNYKNIAYSVARRHQRLICAQLQGSKFFTYDELECGPNVVTESQNHLCDDPLKAAIMSVASIDLESIVSRPRWIKIYGEEYHISDFVLFHKQDDDLPGFGKIKDIVIVGESPMLHVEKYLTTGINNHIMCHQIVRTHQYSVVTLSSLPDCYPYSSHTFIGDSQLYIAMRSDVLL